jgi:hypothetical protein
MALVKYNNNSISAITAASSLSTGAMTLIKEQTASSSSTISFVDGTSDVVLDSTYPIYLFKFINIHPADNAVDFRFQVNAAGGSGYNETITSTGFMSHHYENDSSTGLSYTTSYDQAQGTSPQIICENVGNQADESCAGELWLFGLSSTTYVKHFMARFNLYAQSDYTGDHYTAGYINNTAAIDEVQFTFESGNIDAGTFKLYGIKDS